MIIHTLVAPDATTAAHDCANALAAILTDAIKTRGVATLAVSGGRTPGEMMDRLAQARVKWARVHVFFVDERPVAPGDAQSNYTLCETHLLKPARIPAANIHRIQGELPPAEAAESYRREIVSFFGLEADAKPVFDAIQCGIGPDCHTASLFPGEPAIGDKDGLVAALPVAKMHQTRITLLPAVLRKARKLLVLATGPEKAEALKNALNAPCNPLEYPAQIVVRAPQSELFLDKAAAALAV